MWCLKQFHCHKFAVQGMNIYILNLFCGICSITNTITEVKWELYLTINDFLPFTSYWQKSVWFQFIVYSVTGTYTSAFLQVLQQWSATLVLLFLHMDLTTRLLFSLSSAQVQFLHLRCFIRKLLSSSQQCAMFFATKKKNIQQIYFIKGHIHQRNEF